MQTTQDHVAKHPDYFGFQQILTTILLLIWLRVASTGKSTSEAVSSAIVLCYEEVLLDWNEITYQETGLK